MVSSYFVQDRAISTLVLLSVPFLLTYLITYYSASKAIQPCQGRRKPPVVPYWIPGFGHSLSILWDVTNFAKLTISKLLQSVPVRLKFFNWEINFITGPASINSVWRSKALEAKPTTCFAVEYLFKTPKKAMKMYRTDDSGINPQPNPGSSVLQKDRFYYQSRKASVSFFSGPSSKHIANRLLDSLTKQISRQRIGDEWLECPNLYSFVQALVTGPSIEAMCGPVLMQQNGTFVDDFWKFHKNVLYFVKGCPRWFAPKVWANRDQLLACVKNWHTYAQENFDESSIDADGHDRFYGSPLIRSRQIYLSQIDSFDADAIASQDLGLIWAENANSIPAVFWLIVETLRQPHVLFQAREEITSSQNNSLLPDKQSLNLESLFSRPLLQSSYAEVLRLYTSNIMMRNVVHQDLYLEDWKIPKGSLIAVDGHVAHMNRRLWNTGGATDGAEGAHPVDQFWAQRFLEYPDDPTSGPLRVKNSNHMAASMDASLERKEESPKFTMEGLSGTWIPYGGGSRQCPGNKFAKHQIILAFAAITSTFDIELLEDKGKGCTVPDMRYYGTGTLPPKGKTPFRIRRRQCDPIREGGI